MRFDAGQEFGGPVFLVHPEGLLRIEAAVPGHLSVFRMIEQRTIKRSSSPGQAPDAGLKWRDGALWVQKGRRVFRQGPEGSPWMLMADVRVDFNDFDVDPGGRILLVGTSEPDRPVFRALLESVGADKSSTEVIQPHPEEHPERWLPNVNIWAGYMFVNGYRSASVGDALLLFNPFARRIFLYCPLAGTFKELKLPLPPRTPKDVASLQLDPHKPGVPSWKDLCWQVLPRDGNSAWLILPEASAFEPGSDEKKGGAPGLRAFPVNLAEGQIGEVEELPGLSHPVFLDASGRICAMDRALASFSKPVPQVRP